jgi:hypothetical protein
MGKYEPLQSFLAAERAEEVPMTFAQIEHVIGQSLPPAAFNHRPWWSNNASNNVMTKAWLNAGYKTERVDMEGRKLTFVRVPGEKLSPKSSPPSESIDILARIDELLGGSVTIPEGVDIMTSLGEVWDAER